MKKSLIKLSEILARMLVTVMFVAMVSFIALGLTYLITSIF